MLFLIYNSIQLKERREVTEEEKKELDMLMLEFKGHIDEAEVFLKGGEEAMKSLKAGVSRCNRQDSAEKTASVIATTATGAVAGALFGGAVNAGKLLRWLERTTRYF